MEKAKAAMAKRVISLGIAVLLLGRRECFLPALGWSFLCGQQVKPEAHGFQSRLGPRSLYTRLMGE